MKPTPRSLRPPLAFAILLGALLASPAIQSSASTLPLPLVTTHAKLDAFLHQLDEADLSPGPVFSSEISNTWHEIDRSELTERERKEAEALLLEWKETRLKQILFRWHDLESVPKKLEHLREIRSLEVQLFYPEIRMLVDFKRQPDLRENPAFLSALTQLLKEQGYLLTLKKGCVKLKSLRPPVPLWKRFKQLLKKQAPVRVSLEAP